LKKLTFITITLVFCLPCLLLAYHVLNDLSPSGGFVFNMWANTPVNINIDAGTLAGGNGRTMVEDACDEWDSVPSAKTLCGNLNTSPVDITIDNINDNILPGVINIVFDETEDILLFFGFPPNSTFGFCFPLTNTNTGEITDALLILNGTIPSSPSGDLLATIIHELGHCWGLAHIPIGGITTAGGAVGLDPIEPSKIPTMFPFNIPTNDLFGRTLEDDDKAGISILYPQN